MSATQRHSGGAPLPHHVAIIMDGNGRWAQQRGLPRAAGHREGARAARRIIEDCARRGIRVLTLFAFSSENWRRPSSEIKLLMELFLAALRSESQQLHRNNIRLRLIGERSAFSAKLQARIRHAEELTVANTGLTLVVAANYGGRWDIVQATRQLAAEVAAGRLDAESITTDHVQRHLCLHDLPEPDLFIRTGGEQRISNFLLWQLAYTELYFCDRLWPDFTSAELEAALAAFARRQRRFGMTAEQLECPSGA